MNKNRVFRDHAIAVDMFKQLDGLTYREILGVLTVLERLAIDNARVRISDKWLRKMPEIRCMVAVQ
jgi:hypothetical protein